MCFFLLSSFTVFLHFMLIDTSFFLFEMLFYDTIFFPDIPFPFVFMCSPCLVNRFPYTCSSIYTSSEHTKTFICFHSFLTNTYTSLFTHEIISKSYLHGTIINVTYVWQLFFTKACTCLTPYLLISSHILCSSPQH